MNTPQEPRWFVLAMASRWPTALVLAAWAIAIGAIQIVKQPLPVALPVRLVGGVEVRNIKLPVIQVEAKQPLPVNGSVSVDKSVTVDVSNIDTPIDVGSFTNPVPVGQNEPFAVTGAVTVKEIQGKLNVKVNPIPGGLPIP